MIKELIDFIKAMILLACYSLGYKDANRKRDIEEMKSEIDWRKEVDKKKEEIRARYRELKMHYPDDWDGIEQLRKTSELQSISKACNPSTNSGSKV